MTGTLLRRKTLRDLGAHRSQFVAVLLMALLSTLVLAGLEGGWRGMQRALDSFAEDSALADAWVSGTGLTPADADALAEVDGVEQVAFTTAVDVTVPTAAEDDADATLTLTTAGDDVDAPWTAAGRPFDPAGRGAWVDDRFAAAHGLEPGDDLTVAVGSTTTTLTVEGLVLLPDRVAHSGPGLVAPDPDLFGYAVVGDETLRDLVPGPVGVQTLAVRGDPAAAREAARAQLGDRYLGSADRTTHPAVAPAYERVGQIRSLSFLFSSLFVLVAVLSMVTSIRRLLDIQRGEVATLKALGVRDRALAASFTALGVVVVTTGAVAGLAAAPLLSRFVLSTQEASFALPPWTPAWTIATLTLPVALVLASVVAGWSATRTIRRTSPAEGLRPAPGRARASVLERFRGMWSRISAAGRWAVRDATTAPARLGMGVAATAGCMMLVFAGFGMPDTLRTELSASYDVQYRYGSRVAVSPVTPPEQLAEIAERAGPGQWIDQMPMRVDPDDGVDRTLTVLDEGDLFRPLGADKEPIDVGAGALVSRRLLDDLGLDVGDPITVDAPSIGTLTFEVVGATEMSEPQGVTVPAADLADAGGTFAPSVYLSRDAVTRGDLEDLPAVTGVLTLEQQRANATELVESLDGVFTLIRVFAVVLAVVVLHNLGALGFAERARDYATLRVLGLRTGELRSLASRENIATTLTGWILGIPAGLWFLERYVTLFSTPRAVYTPSITTTSVVAASAVTIGSALTATVLLVRRVRAVDMTQALKSVE